MERYCSQCGKELTEGKCPDCKEQQVVKETGIGAIFKDFDFENFFNSMIDMAKGMLVAPSDTIKKYANEKYMLYGLIAMVICGIITGIFGYFVTKELMGSIYSLMYGSYSPMLGSNLLFTEIPVFKTIMVTALYTIASFACMILFLNLTVRYVFKKEVPIKKIVASFGPLAVFNTISLLTAVILLFLSIKLAFIVYLVLLLCYMVYVIQAIKNLTDVEDNRLAYFYTLVITATLFVVGYILPKLFS